MPIKNWSTTAASNTSAPPNGAPEGMAPSAVNDIFRQQMADHKTQWQDAEWFDWGDSGLSRASATTFKLTGDVTTRYLVNRRVKFYDSSTLYGTVTASSYSAPDTTVTVTMDSGTLSASLTSVAIAILSPTNKSMPAVVYDENTPIKDTSSNELLKFSKTSSAVNEVTITNQATGTGPSIAATGDDTNIPVTLKGKGAGAVILGQSTSTDLRLAADQPIGDSSGNELIKFTKAASAVNEFTVGNAATGANPSLTATGGDSNIGLDFQGKGAGVYNFKSTSTQSTYTRWYEDTDNGSNYIEHQTPASLTANRIISWPDSDISNHLVQIVRANATAFASGTTTIPWDDTPPQITEGTEFLTATITPKNSSNTLEIFANFHVSNTVLNDVIMALFQDATANALAAMAIVIPTASYYHNIYLFYTMTAGTTSATTFRIRMGGTNASTTGINGQSGARKLGGVLNSTLNIKEYSA